MEMITYQYPGDPVATAVLMNRKEFKNQFTRHPITIYQDGRIVSEYPLEHDEIHCDFCDADPGDTITLMCVGMKALCQACANRVVMPHVCNQPPG